LKTEDFGNLFEYLSAPSAFISNKVKIDDRQLCIHDLTEPPEKICGVTPLDDWSERLKPFIKDYKLEVLKKWLND
jgi:hypothetical protein